MLVLALGGFAFALPASSRADNSADIAVIDRALATAKPGDKFVRFGDVGIKIQDLQIFRARLSGDAMASQTTGSAPERLDGVSPHPNADTPNGTAFKWPGGNVYYRFDPTQVSNNTITAAKMQQFRDSVAEWAAFANLHFIENISGQPNFITVQRSGQHRRRRFLIFRRHGRRRTICAVQSARRGIAGRSVMKLVTRSGFITSNSGTIATLT